ncbi:MAG: substrate-binding domain-containing protein [Pirellulales bacterium]|nr:substrate-binding domain-containing protein [Pirellulales bacterium]
MFAITAGRCAPGVSLGLLVFLLSFCGCGNSPQNSSGQPAKLRIAMIPKGTTHQFWKSVHYGADQAARELDVELIWQGPLKEDDRQDQINTVDNFITKGVDGICLAPLDKNALLNVVKSAGKNKIPTVIFDSALADPAAAVSYVATDNYNGGVLAARELGRLLNGQGKIILLRYAEGSESTEQREKGFLDTVAKEFPQLEFLSQEQYAGATVQTALQVAKQLLVKHGDQVQGIFAVNESCATGMLKALRDAKLAGKVKFIGFDTGEELRGGLETGEVHGLILQNPIKIGNLSVKTVVASLRGEQVEPNQPTGEMLATPANRTDPAVQALLVPRQL